MSGEQPCFGFNFWDPTDMFVCDRQFRMSVNEIINQTPLEQERARPFGKRDTTNCQHTT